MRYSEIEHIKPQMDNHVPEFEQIHQNSRWNSKSEENEKKIGISVKKPKISVTSPSIKTDPHTLETLNSRDTPDQRILVQNCEKAKIQKKNSKPRKKSASLDDSAGKLKRRAGNLQRDYSKFREIPNPKNEIIEFNLKEEDNEEKPVKAGNLSPSPLDYSEDENPKPSDHEAERFKIGNSKDLILHPNIPVKAKTEMQEIPEITLSKESSVKKAVKEDIFLFPNVASQNIEKIKRSGSKKSMHTQTTPKKRKRKKIFGSKKKLKKWTGMPKKRSKGTKSSRVIKKKTSGSKPNFFSSRHSSTSSLRNFNIGKSNIKMKRKKKKRRNSSKKRKFSRDNNSLYTRSIDTRHKGSFGTEIRSLVGRILEDDKERVVEDELEISRIRDSVIEGSRTGSKVSSSIKKKKKKSNLGNKGRHLNWGNNVDPMMRHHEKRHFFDQDQFLQTHKIFPADLGLR